MHVYTEHSNVRAVGAETSGTHFTVRHLLPANQLTFNRWLVGSFVTFLLTYKLASVGWKTQKDAVWTGDKSTFQILKSTQANSLDVQEIKRFSFRLRAKT